MKPGKFVSTREEKIKRVKRSEKMQEMFSLKMKKIKNVDVKTLPKNGDVISMTVYRPTQSSPLLPLLPGAVFIHGGGMASFTGKEEHYDAQCRILASLKCVVFCLHFTNSTEKMFPAALNECVTAVKWILGNEDKYRLQKSGLLVFGESGGGNLSLAVGMSLRGDSRVRAVVALCPFIYGDYRNQISELPSLKEFDRIMLEKENMANVADLYTENDKRNPLAWPYWSSKSDLEGMCPTHIILNECDPLYSEGFSFYHKLQDANVFSMLTILGGTMHGGHLVGAKFTQYVMRQVLDFANMFGNKAKL